MHHFCHNNHTWIAIPNGLIMCDLLHCLRIFIRTYFHPGRFEHNEGRASKWLVGYISHRCQPSRIRRDSPAFSSDVPRPAKWDKCPAFLENCIIFFVADYFTCLPCNATKWRTFNKSRSILRTPTNAVYISRAAAVINDCLLYLFNVSREILHTRWIVHALSLLWILNACSTIIAWFAIFDCCLD